MPRTRLTLLASALLVLSACTSQEQRQASDTALDEQRQQETQDYNENTETVSSVPTEPEVLDANAGVDAQVNAEEQAWAGQPEAAGQYALFTDDVLADGKTKVLFFSASWCPVCRSADVKLKDWYAADGFPLNVYSVDYDSRDDLRSRYGVTYQHTFVKVDGEGNALQTLQSPSDAQLQAMLQA